MLVVTSNWSITDGTLVPATAACHGLLSAAIHRAACRAGLRRDGRYEPIDRLDLVLAGDTFDWILSAEWQGRIKPWHGSAAAREAAMRAARRSIHLGRRSLGPLVRWARHGMRVPAASRGRPARWAITVPTRVTVLAGDRDATLEQVIGTRQERQPVTVGWQWDDGRVSIRHGHDLDPAWGPAARDVGRHDRQPTLGESVGVDLIGRFVATAVAETPAVRRLCRRLAGANPAEIPAAIAAWLASPFSRSGGQEGMDSHWRRCVDAWWHEARRTVPSCEVEFDVVDALASTLAASFVAADVASPMLAALRPAMPRGSAGLVLGHLPGGWSHAAPVCLGSGDTDAPHIVACCESAGWPRWESILPVDHRPPVVAIRGRSSEVVRGGTVVDAA